MFDVGFSELCMVGLVSLLVIGPEKLPQVARVAGFWLGKMRRMVANVQAEIKEELHTEEMRRILQEQEELYRRFELEREHLQNSMLAETKHIQQELTPSLTELAERPPIEPLAEQRAAVKVPDADVVTHEKSG